MGWGDKAPSAGAAYQALINFDEPTSPSEFVEMVEGSDRVISDREVGYVICSRIDNRKTTLVYSRNDQSLTVGTLKNDLQGMYADKFLRAVVTRLTVSIPSSPMCMYV